MHQLLSLNIPESKMHIRFWPLLFVAVFPLLLVGCDAAGSDTIVLDTTSDDTELDPIVYEFRYDGDDVENGTIEVTSEGSGNLDELLRRNGFTRENVVSATIKEATLIRRSSSNASASLPKVFQYLTGGTAEVFLGTSASGKRFAERSIESTDRRISLNIVNGGDVTSEVKAGSKQAFLRFAVSGSVSGEDAVDVKVSYQIEVQGV